ncbi:hypothetical protein E4U59_006170 [Claviceps monticola]|nr:hypothetical protein E4U59_006170 [Claviceps monticola]
MTTFPSPFVIHDERVTEIFGPAPRLELLHHDPNFPFAHEAGVFFPQTNTLIVTSNQLFNRKTQAPWVRITGVRIVDGPHGSVECMEIDARNIPMANGAVNYKQGVLFCAQGNRQHRGGLIYMDSEPPYKTETLLSSFYGRQFNSVNDVVIHSDGSIWFTDPVYGFDGGFRDKPRLPCQVYRFDPARKSVRAMADGFGRPNGICFSPDERTVYVTDTDWIHGDGTTDEFRASHIYAFDVTFYAGEPFLTNRRLFAMADTGIPDGIKCDVYGNVYSGCGDGINIWSAGGVLLGRIIVPGGVANFCFGREGTLYLLNEHRLWRAQLASSTKGALLGV